MAWFWNYNTFTCMAIHTISKMCVCVCWGGGVRLVIIVWNILPYLIQNFKMCCCNMSIWCIFLAMQLYVSYPYLCFWLLLPTTLSRFNNLAMPIIYIIIVYNIELENWGGGGGSALNPPGVYTHDLVTSEKWYRKNDVLNDFLQALTPTEFILNECFRIRKTEDSKISVSQRIEQLFYQKFKNF